VSSATGPEPDAFDMKNKPPAGEATSKVQKGIDEVREFYRIGFESLEESPDRIDYNKTLTGIEAQKKGMSAELLRKARQFAHSYTPQQLDTLLGRCRSHGRVIGTSHVIQFLRARDVSTRQRLQKQFIDGRYSVHQLGQAVTSQQGARRSGGRRPKLAADAAGLLDQIEAMCGQWRRWHAELTRPVGKNKEQLEKLLPASVQDELRQAVVQLTKLQHLVGGKLSSEKPGRRQRSTVHAKKGRTKRRKKYDGLIPDLFF
jgi:hypothetical protein